VFPLVNREIFCAPISENKVAKMASGNNSSTTTWWDNHMQESILCICVGIRSYRLVGAATANEKAQRVQGTNSISRGRIGRVRTLE
jgi:hypothetical protein